MIWYDILLLIVTAVVVYGGWEDYKQLYLSRDLSWVITLSLLGLTVLSGNWIIVGIFLLSMLWGLRKSSASKLDKKYISLTIVFDVVLASLQFTTGFVVLTGLIFIFAYMVYLIDHRGEVVIPALVPLAWGQVVFTVFYFIITKTSILSAVTG